MEDFLKCKGRIFDIQRFSVHDGPGIRTIVFLKGCALRCRWCCNPESQNFAIEQMRMDGKQKQVGEDVTVLQVLDRVLKDLPYYRRSGGGVTLSGGETLCQAEFARALLMQLKEHGIHTAVETTGYASYETIESLLPYLDLVLMDLKHMDAAKHAAFTTKSNALILENAVKIANNAKELIIRVPVIPTFNDTPEEILAIADFAASLPGVKRLHLLPYHRLGTDKYQGLGRTYTLPGIQPPADATMQALLRAAASCGLDCQIGG